MQGMWISCWVKRLKRYRTVDVGGHRRIHRHSRLAHCALANAQKRNPGREAPTSRDQSFGSLSSFGRCWKQRNRAEKRPVPEHRSEEHTSELQSLMRISYAVFCLKKKT